MTTNTTAVGTINNKKLHKRSDGARFYVCTLTCPHCGRAHRLAFAGWSAIACSCGTDVYRSTAAMK